MFISSGQWAVTRRELNCTTVRSGYYYTELQLKSDLLDLDFEIRLGVPDLSPNYDGDRHNVSPRFGHAMQWISSDGCPVAGTRPFNRPADLRMPCRPRWTDLRDAAEIVPHAVFIMSSSHLTVFCRWTNAPLNESNSLFPRTVSGEPSSCLMSWPSRCCLLKLRTE